MQQILFVTVQGMQRRLDIELPADTLVSDLLPLLLEMCNRSPELTMGAQQSKTPWTLYVANLGQSLRGTQTLAEGGVLDGDVLLLEIQDTSRGSAKKKERDTVKSIEANEQTGMIGVTWEKGWPF